MATNASPSAKDLLLTQTSQNALMLQRMEEVLAQNTAILKAVQQPAANPAPAPPPPQPAPGSTLMISE